MYSSSAVRCYRIAYGFGRNIFKAGDIQSSASKRTVCNTLANWTHTKWQLATCHSVRSTLDMIPRGRPPIPLMTTCQLLHHSPKIPNDRDGLNAKKQTESQEDTIGQQHQQKESENAESDQNLEVGDQVTDPEPEAEKPQTLLQRFKQTYKEYGKILIGVHVFTSCIWGTSFYYMAASGIDVVPLLEWLGAGDKIIAPFSVPGVGSAAVAYLMYKLATPLRYMVTIGGTRVAVNVLRRWGYLPPIPEKNRIRSLVKEGQVKMKARYKGIKKGDHEK